MSCARRLVALALICFRRLWCADARNLERGRWKLLPWFRPLETLSGWSARLPVFWRSPSATELTFCKMPPRSGDPGLLRGWRIWCLLEYRVSRDVRWLKAAAVVWGAGMAEDWVMLFTLPFLSCLGMVAKVQIFQPSFYIISLAVWAGRFAIYACCRWRMACLPFTVETCISAGRFAQGDEKHLGLFMSVFGKHTGWLLPFCVLLIPLLDPGRFGNETPKTSRRGSDAHLGISQRAVGLLFSVSGWPSIQISGRAKSWPANPCRLPIVDVDYLNALRCFLPAIFCDSTA